MEAARPLAAAAPLPLTSQLPDRGRAAAAPRTERSSRHAPAALHPAPRPGERRRDRAARPLIPKTKWKLPADWLPPAPDL